MHQFRADTPLCHDAAAIMLASAGPIAGTGQPVSEHGLPGGVHPVSESAHLIESETRCAGLCAQAGARTHDLQQCL